MKHKMLLLILAAMLTAVAAHAAPVCGDGDTLWTKSMLPKSVDDAMFHPSGDEFIVRFYQQPGIVVFDSFTGDSLREFKTNLSEEPILWKIDISSDGNYLFAIGGSKCFLWDYHTGELIKYLEKEAYSGKFIPNTDTLIFIGTYPSQEDNFFVYDIGQDSIVFSEGKHWRDADFLSAIGASPDGNYLALCFTYSKWGESKYSIQLFNAHTLEFIDEIMNDKMENVLSNDIYDIEFSQNSKWVGANKGSTQLLFNLEKYFSENIKEQRVTDEGWEVRFAGDDNTLFFSSGDKISLIRLIEQDTIYYVNARGAGRYNKMTNNWIGITSRKISMYNNALYYLDVPDMLQENNEIELVKYQNGMLSYKVDDINAQNISVTDSRGRTIYSNQTTNTNNQLNITLPSGVYFFTVSDGQRDYTKKFLVVN